MKASFYHRKFDGRKTASGEIYRNNRLTAAHLKLPFGTMLRLTNTKTHKSVWVEVNDRGPYVKGRQLDISLASAKALDMVKDGVAVVRVDKIITRD